MSDPTIPKPHSGFWTATWNDPRRPGEKRGRPHMKRFGRCDVVSRSEALRRWRRWLDKEWPRLKLAGETAYSVDQLCRDYYQQMGRRYIVNGKHTTSVVRIRIALDSLRARYGAEEANEMTAGKVAVWVEGYIHERLRSGHEAARVCHHSDKASEEKGSMLREHRHGNSGAVSGEVSELAQEHPKRRVRDDLRREAGRVHRSCGIEGTPKPRTKETCNLALTYVKAMYRWAAKYGKVSDAAAGAVQLAENLRSDHPELRKTERIMPVSWETVEATKVYCPPILRSMIDVMWLTGCRPGEALAMRPMDLGVFDGMHVYAPPHHKTSHKGKMRNIVLGPRAWAILEHLLPNRTDERIFSISMTSGNLARYIRRRAKAAGVEAWTLNQIRHSYATRGEDEFGSEMVTAVLGHSNDVQQRVYVERSLKKAMEVAKAVG